jgi:hypothetical protein
MVVMVELVVVVVGLLQIQELVEQVAMVLFIYITNGGKNEISLYL